LFVLVFISINIQSLTGFSSLFTEFIFLLTRRLACPAYRQAEGRDKIFAETPI
jgi:hypothetical protein